MSEILPPILVAEDEESDRMILERVFKGSKLSHPLVIVQDGQEAVNYLCGEGRYANRTAHPLPALVVLDLKMPRMNGFDVLAWLATQPELKSLAAVVLSSSSNEADIQKAHRLGAREYFVKPHSLDKLAEILKRMHARWLSGDDLPTAPFAFIKSRGLSRILAQVLLGTLILNQRRCAAFLGAETRKF